MKTMHKVIKQNILSGFYTVVIYLEIKKQHGSN